MGLGANRGIIAPHASPQIVREWRRGSEAPHCPPPCLWQGKGEGNFLLNPWYDGLKRESYDGLEGEPKRSGRIRSMIVEPNGEEDNFHCQTRWARDERR